MSKKNSNVILKNCFENYQELFYIYLIFKKKLNSLRNKSFVIADFNPLEADYSVNRLYTSMILSLGVMSFIMVTYGLHSALGQFVSPA